MAREPYRQTVPGVDVSIEKATPRVPEGRNYYVFQDGRVLGKHRTLQQATLHFRHLLDEIGWKPPTIEIKPRDPAEEAVERYMDTLEAYWDDAAKHRRSGGKTMSRS